MNQEIDEGPQINRPSPQQPDLTDLATEVASSEVGERVPTAAELPPLSEFNLIAEFDSPEQARDAIVAVERAGIDGSKISYLTFEPPEADDEMVDHQADSDELTGLGKSTARGASVGTIGGAAIGVVAAIIPGVGPVIGAGILGAALGMGFAGGTVGGIWGAFSHMAASPAWDSTFVAIQNGASLVGVHTETLEEAEIARSALPSTAQLFDRNGNKLDGSPSSATESPTDPAH